MSRRIAITTLLERQAAWQRARASLSWEEKLRQSLVMREAQWALRGGGVDPKPVKEARRPPARRLPR